MVGAHCACSWCVTTCDLFSIVSTTHAEQSMRLTPWKATTRAGIEICSHHQIDLYRMFTLLALAISVGVFIHPERGCRLD